MQVSYQESRGWEFAQEVVVNKNAQQITWAHQLGWEHLVGDSSNDDDHHVLKSYFTLGPGLKWFIPHNSILQRKKQKG